MEIYKIGWLQSAHYKASTQNVLAEIAGAPPITILADAAMNVASLEYVFPTGASVLVKVRTFNEAKSEFADLDFAPFVAEDKSPLSPATSPTVVWVGHE